MSETEIVESSDERTRVSFPEVPPEKPKSNKGLFIVILLLLLLLGAGGWYTFGRQANISLMGNDVTPTPTEEVAATNTPTPTEAEKEVEREGVKVQVLNGTGISGAAGELQDALEELGYEGIKVGNAPSQNATSATVVFDSEVEETVREDIVKLLESMYQSVDDSEKAMTDFDVVITTGNPKGGSTVRATTAPTRSVTASKTPTPSPRTSTTITPTKTPTPTP